MKETWENPSKKVDDIIFTTPLPDKKILSLAQPNSICVLDIGCGYGRVLKFMKENGYRNLTGIDISEKLIEIARKNCPEAKYYTGDIEKIQLEQKYHLILIMGVIEYILTDENQRDFFEKVKKTLTPEGHVLLETFVLDYSNISNIWQYTRGFTRTGHWGRFKNSKGYECHHQSYDKMLKIVTDLFEVVSHVRQKYLTWSGTHCEGYTLILKNR